MTSESVYQLPEGLSQDLEQLRQLTRQFQKGEISAARYQAFRVPCGIYEQRKSGEFMLRARLAAGILSPAQMRIAAEVAETYGDATLHLTSRQDLQVHGVKLAGIYPAAVRLTEAGLSTKGGGGNTVRNITACYLAGVCPTEVFDVTSHVVSLTEHLLRDPLSYQLPRKYKISCSGCGRDCAGATVNDLGFISKRKSGVDGFAVYVGGGMGAQSRVGVLLEEFIPATQVHSVAKAVKRVFDKHGDRKNRNRARIRFLIEDMGIGVFEKYYREELSQANSVAIASTPRMQDRPLLGSDRDTPPSAGFSYWRDEDVIRQKQDGYFAVEISPPLGMLHSAQIRRLADIVEHFGEGVIRATHWQNAILRWVPTDQLPALHAKLSAIGLGSREPALLRHLVTCAGASTCRTGICLSRGVSDAIRRALLASNLNLKGAAGEVALNISGCPNACGRHPVGQIGLYGVARRHSGHLVPHYVVQFGGHVEEAKTILATGVDAIPARDIPAFLVEVLQSFEVSAQYPDFDAYLGAGGRRAAKELARKYTGVPDFSKDKNYYFDWGADTVFSLAGRGPGECGAGVFDLIQVDLASAAEALESERLFSATALVARALLVTRGEQADADLQALKLFYRLFVEEGLVSAECRLLIDKAQKALVAPDPEGAFDVSHKEVAGFLAEVRRLYESMGSSLRLPATACAVRPAAKQSQEAIAADLVQDLRGVVCPLNYVKTKLALEKLSTGQILAVMLDEAGSRNVPASAAGDGHEVLSIIPEEQHWRVIIRKAK
jgi:sulfite reductase (ferredoxin)